MHSLEIIEALWEEGKVLDLMGYDYDATIFEYTDGVRSNVVTEKYIQLYYFTAL